MIQCMLTNFHLKFEITLTLLVVTEVQIYRLRNLIDTTPYRIKYLCLQMDIHVFGMIGRVE